MNIKPQGNQLEIIDSEDTSIVAEYYNSDWIVTFAMFNGIPEYSCLAQFSTRILVDNEILEKANLLRQAWKYLGLTNKDKPIEWDDETIMPIVHKIILENHGQFKLNLI